ncbi:MAG: sigma-70 family RNA polymerase sigma factor [Phycisphaerales bacterium]|nr:sigma-70 family RNA polymerase sigma factor [Phycisphaerales bacterium]MCB9857268.1 sigma-70 family RNA polymerase sigma factor [Phycisphaerales bacterium]MCB9863018.1 sigma-70 family RNA polymerase sigma factor [Phycisphaerales bacterium]
MSKANHISDEARAQERQQDAADVAATLDGRLDAFDKLIERYQRRAVSVSYRLLGNIQDAQDVCQRAFVKSFRSLSTLKDQELFGSWLMRIVSNLSLNHRRDRKPHLSLATSEGDTGVPEAIASAGRSDGDSPSSAMETSEAETAIREAMDSLPEKQRMALVLFAIEKMPQKDVAEIMECSVEMVKWNVFQARKSLKQALAHLIEE